MASIAETRQDARKERSEKQQAELRRNFDFVTNACYGHLNSRIEDRWAGYRMTNGLLFTEGARTRIGSIFGWIQAMAYHDKDLAIRAADDFCGQLDNLRDYGGEHTVNGPNGRADVVSEYRIELNCDGTLHGFGVLWFMRCENDYDGKTEERLRRDDYLRTRYRFSFNGGLLYHGPGGGEVFAATLGGNQLWSIHT